MRLSKLFGILCIGITLLGVISEVRKWGLSYMVTYLPRLIVHIAMLAAGGFCISPDASHNKRMVLSLVACIGALYGSLTVLISLHTVTPAAVINLCYLPVCILLYIAVMKERPGKA